MSELRLTPAHESIKKAIAVAPEPVSLAERELTSFVNALANVFGPDA